MRILVFNSKGGCAKSLIAREIIAGPKAKNFVVVEIDPLNRTQNPYTNFFKEVIELDGETVEELLVQLLEHENIVVDVGSDHLSSTLAKIVEFKLFDDIDRIVIPLLKGRTDAENAIKTFKVISNFTDKNKIIFALGKAIHEENVERQFEIFFNNSKNLKIKPKYAQINYSDVFTTAEKENKLVVDLANGEDYKALALKAKDEGKMGVFRDLMKKEILKRSAQILMDKTILPAHEKILAA